MFSRVQLSIARAWLCRLYSSNQLYSSPNVTTTNLRRTATTMQSPRRDSQIPLIVIIGPTGTGKSKLAVALAKHLTRSLPATKQNENELGAEIINADAMQLYEGLPIITNKLSIAEQEGIPHHLLGEISLREETWTIHRYLREADSRIDLIRRKARVPIVVGGTGYYVHGLLLGDTTLRSEVFEDNEERGKAIDKLDEVDSGIHALQLNNPNKLDDSEIDRILQGTNAELLAKLEEVDPEMAKSWHPNDRRKIQRSLEIWLKTGKKASEIYAAQRNRNNTPVKARAGIEDELHKFPHYDPLIFWLDAEDAILKERLNSRVDAMVKSGMFGEARAMAEFEKDLKAEGTPVERDRGIWASIGFKEIEPWLQHIANPYIDREDKASLQLRESCIEAVKAGTRQYARRQNRYVRIRLANALAETGLRHQLFLLDCSQVSDWQNMVEAPATSIVDTFLAGQPLPDPAGLSSLAASTLGSMAGNKLSSVRNMRRCELCDKIMMTDNQWSQHINSSTHKKKLQAIKKRDVLRHKMQPEAATGTP